MKCRYILIVLLFFAAGKANAQPFTYEFNFDGYYDVQTEGRWQKTLYERYYNNKVFYIPPAGSGENYFNICDQTTHGETGIQYDKNSCYDGSTRWHFRIYYNFGGDPNPVYGLRYVPSTVGTTNVAMNIFYWAEGSCGSDGWTYQKTFHNFNITVEKPEWYTSVSAFQNMCQNVDTNYNLADYFSVPGATFNIDYSGDTTWQYPDFPNYSRDFQIDNYMYEVSSHWAVVDGNYVIVDDTTWQYPGFPNYSREYQMANNMCTPHPHLITQLNPHNLSPGVHTLLAMKTYDNGEPIYFTDFSGNPVYNGSRRGQVLFPVTITVLPAAPLVNSISATSTCAFKPDAEITMSGISGGDGTYRFLLRYGLNNNSGCDPRKDCFSDVSASDSFSRSSYTITNRSAGDYTLWIANDGGNTGACARTYNIVVPKLSVMDTLPIAIQHVSCPGDSNGVINVTDTGGRAPYTFTLTLNGVESASTTGRFTALPSGSYTMQTKDACDQVIQRTIALTEPLPVNISATASATDCNYPANGTIDINASGGSGTFDYYLYDSTGATVSQQPGSTAATWSIPALGAGNYTAVVNNTATPGCEAVTKPVVVIGPPALLINYIGQTNNNCSYDANGTLQLSAGGGQLNGYIFFLQNTATGQLLQSATGSFGNLPVASYKAWVRNRDVSCLDSALYALPIDITSPPVLQSHASATDITCNGKGDGSLQANIGGGTPGYNLQWQQLDDQAANWLPMNGMTALSQTNLQKGTYRLQVADQNGCGVYSDTVTIAEPSTLTISSVNRNDIVCYGGTGSIQMNVSGGNGNYIYELSSDNGSNWNAFTASTALVEGSYRLRVSDAKACVTPYSQNIDITAPASPLTIGYTLTDYNGYNVPCYGGINGLVKLSATGGNGSTYTGYTFTEDNGTFNTTATIASGAGDHIFSVKDARGCIVSVTATLTQPAAQMQTTNTKRDNDCAGGRAGEITLSAVGGTPQYTFSINGIDYQPSPVFSALLSGNYQVITHDVNGCPDTTNVSIVDLNPPVTDQPVISNVSCYNGTDGSIALTPGGGVPSYSYTWKNSTVTGNVLSGLPTGKYYVTITDSKGCSAADSFVVAQPLHPLSATIYARPVCINNPNGNVVFNAQGGTAPYVYSIDGGSSFSSNAQFNNVMANSYPAKVVDAHGCTWSGTATVAVNNMNPTLNFLISTRQNALDTLQVKEVCIPKPDSVQWTFDAQAIIIDNNMFNPLIRYNHEGNYPVTMRAWFGGCDFTTSKMVTINPYDPGVVNNYNSLYGIDTVVVTPNPNNGNFNLQVKLYKNQRLNIKVYTVTGVVLWSRQWDYVNQVQEQVSLPANIGNGILFIKVLTDDDAHDMQMLINK